MKFEKKALFSSAQSLVSEAEHTLEMDIYESSEHKYNKPVTPYLAELKTKDKKTVRLSLRQTGTTNITGQGYRSTRRQCTRISNKRGG